MSASVYGIKETKEALQFGLFLYALLKQILGKGKGWFDLLPMLLQIVAPARAAIEGAHLIAKEASDLQPEEVDELLGMARPVLEELTPDELEPMVWRIIAAARMFAEAIGLLK